MKAKQERIVEKQLLVTGITIFGLFLLYLAVTWYVHSLAQFDYQGLHFTKEKFDKLTVYHYYYYYNSSSGKITQYNLYLQHDPRTNSVPYEGDPLYFDKKTVYIAVDNSYPSTCVDNAASLLDISSFLADNSFNVIVGFMNETYAREVNKTYARCSSKPNSHVVEFFAGNQTRIFVQGRCIQISIGPECRIREAVEKFKIQAILDAKSTSLVH